MNEQNQKIIDLLSQNKTLKEISSELNLPVLTIMDRIKQMENKKIIDLLGNGKALKQISGDLKMPERTIKERLKRLRDKYNCVNNTQLVVHLLLHLKT